MTSAIPLNPIDFPLSGTRLIEASAGTGKTYTIAALYVRLILGDNPGSAEPSRYLLPPDILVVTFTEAATKELRERIRERLSQAARFFRQQLPTTDAFLQDIRDCYAEQDWPACARRLELAANWMDESAVYTIHSWCNRMLQQHAFDSGSLFRQEVNTDDTELLNEVVRDYWRSFYYEMSNDADFPSLYAVFKHPDELLLAVRSLLGNAEPIPFSLADGQSIKELISAVASIRQSSLQELKAPWLNWLPEVRELLEAAIENKVLPAKNYNSANRRNWLDKIEAWSLDPLQDTLDIGKGFENLSPAGMAKLANPGQTSPDHPGFAAIGQLPARLAALPSLKVELIKHAVHWIRQRYDFEKQRIARMTFDDMLNRLDTALQGQNGDRLAEVIRQQYPIALIDEFQDTDPVQYRIFSTLYATPAAGDSACLMIGDPKQAIYSFRGADIYTYLKAHRDTQGRHYTLSTNYRSTQALVDAVNQVFLQADRQDRGAFRFKTDQDNPLPFLPVKAQGRDDVWVVDNQAAPALTLWHWESEDAVGMPAYRETLAEVTASEIVRLLNAADSGQAGFRSASGWQALQPGDIAILVRSGTEASAIRNALARRRLRSVYLSERDSIFASAEAVDMLLWLNALAEPRNERKVRAALSSATFGWSYQALHELALDEPGWELHLERFLVYQQRWQQDGILPALRQLINDYGLHTRLADDSEGERSITNLLHLAELLQQASMQLEGEQALIRHLAEAIEAGGSQAGDDDGIIRLESDANLIKVVTIHKSKGLEYPLVFLPFICSFREVGGRFNAYYRYHDENRYLQIDLHKQEHIKAISEEERLQEDLRLLYVAMTRARHACWLGIAPVKSGSNKDCQLEKSAMGALLNWRTKLPTSELASQLRELKGSCDAILISPLPEIDDARYSPVLANDGCDEARVPLSKVASNWWIASYSALHIADQPTPAADQFRLLPELETAHDDKQNDEAEIAAAVSKPQSGVHGLPRGAAPGVLIHDLLEECAQLGFASVSANPALRQELLQKRFTGGEWENKHTAIGSVLAHWLDMPLLEDSDLSLATLGINTYQAELEFLLGADTVDTQELDRLVTRHTFGGQTRPDLLPGQVNGLLKGFIDLVFVHDKRYYVVDYKFNSLGNDETAYTREALAAAMLAKRYDLQYSLYLLALHRLLKVRLGNAYHYDTHIGGGLYLFLRGAQAPTAGRIFDKPPRILIESLDKLFAASIDGAYA
ncbi:MULTISPECIES: exodeoxyribonuclease V subunit beta [Methylomonas]|uniref:RecBCD enzyme subunit RecB n=2 Tax=Methylomonas TaxID=416 RepID=A0A140E737_9GAMM|nr:MULTISPECIES: exodeoxyribonuclease V subunit beta [Methylomonas]AMK79211.1 exodeoxyribonuclease V subunit beta [Methylomonas denitrificans]OAH98159.1 exodeoxyribonuclease V subunit beta [Methylomonas methanica]TCV86270.1 DNA helicase/exodeoxyribonuclease V beta subunit [Methylomonas methanica]